MRKMFIAKQWERFQSIYKLAGLDSGLEGAPCPAWQLQLQKIVDETMLKYVSQSPELYTGLHLLRLFGETYTAFVKQHDDGELKLHKQMVTHVPQVVQLLLRSLCDVVWHETNTKKIHLFIVDESIPVVQHIYKRYLLQSAEDPFDQSFEQIIIHFLLEDKQMILTRNGAAKFSVVSLGKGSVNKYEGEVSHSVQYNPDG